ncbi:MAG: cell division topological specificity factor MinE [Cyanobacteriota bacterium]|nr:cell division topological specificity factor MinE [Cyanobacteriota bacterium]
MSLIDFINRLLGRQSPSANTARQRLQLVLAHDRSDLNPELLEQMRREILEVVQKYVEIDLDGGDVSLETEDRVTALVANLPIKRARPLQTPQEEAAASDHGPADDGPADDEGAAGNDEAPQAPVPAWPATAGEAEDAAAGSEEDRHDGEARPNDAAEA